MNSQEYALLYFFLFILRIIITIYCVNRARKLNRNVWGWGIFGFFLPIVALIWIQFIKPRVTWVKNPDLQSPREFTYSSNVKTSSFNSREFNFWLGLVLLSIGIILLIDRYIPRIDFGDLWPLILMVIGAGLLIRRNKYK